MNIETGALMPVDADGQHIRFSWEKGPGSDRRRALPAGPYHLTVYRVLTGAANGTAWHLSATKPKLRKIVVEAGRSLKIEIDPRVHVAPQLTPGSISAGVLGDGDAGLTIYRSGRRIPLGYHVPDAEDHELARGAGAPLERGMTKERRPEVVVENTPLHIVVKRTKTR